MDWEDPQPLADSPLNPHRPDYYTGPTTSRLIAGAGAGEADMGNVNDPWGSDAPAQPPVPPPAPAPAPPVDRTAQLIQQMAILRDKNLRLQNDVTDLRQRAMQRGRPGAPAYHPDPDHYSILCPPRWMPPGQGPVGNWDADEPPLSYQQGQS